MASQAETQVTFRLPRKLAQRIERVARRTGRRRSEVLREAAAAYVEVLDGDAGAGRYAQVRDLIGSLRSGQPDLGSRHAEYLKRVLNRGR